MKRKKTDQNPEKNKSVSKSENIALDVASSIINTTSDGIIGTNLKGEITFWNKGATKMYKYSKKEILGKHVTLLYKADNKISAEDRIKRVLAGEVFSNDEVQVLDNSGNTLTVLMSLNGIKDDKGNITHVVGITKDITGQKLAQKTLEDSEFRFSQAFNNSPIPESVLNLKTGKRLAVNSTFCKKFGYTKEELVNEANFIKNNIATDQKEFNSIYNKIREEGSIFEYPFTMRTKSGDVREVLVNGTRVYPDNDDIYITSYLDVTERKKAENNLIYSERKFRNLAETAQVAIAIHEEPPGNRFLYVNPYWEKLTGYSRKEAKKLNPLDLLAPKFHKVLSDEPNRSLPFETTLVKNEVEIISKSGETKWINFTAIPIDFEGRKAVLRTALDITMQKNVEAELLKAKENAEQSQNYLDRIINNIGDPVFVKDEKSKFLLVNDAFCEFLGLTREEIIGKTLAEDVSPEEQKIFLKIDRQVLKTGKENINKEKLTIRGRETKSISTKKTRFIDETGKKHLIGVIRDITEQENVERELKKAQEIARLGSWYLDISSGEITWSDELYKMYGFDPALPVPPISEHKKFLNAESWELLNSSIDHTARTGMPYSIELKTNKKIGEKWQWFRALGEAVFDSEKNIIALRGVAQDITERKIAEEKIKESEESINSILNSLKESVCVINEQGQILMVNDAWIEFGESNQNSTVVSKSYTDYNYFDVCRGDLQDDDAKNVLEGLLGLLQGSTKEFSYEYPCHSPGQKRWFLLRADSMKTQEKQIVISHTDITPRKLSEENIKETLTQLNLAVNTAKLGVWSHNIDSGKLEWNNELFEIFGVNPSEFDYSIDTFMKMIHPEDLGFLMEHYSIMYQNKPVSMVNYRIIRPNGEVRYVYASATPIIDEDNNVNKIMGITLDVTESKKAEEKLAKANAELIDAVSSLNELKKQLEDQNIYLKKELDLVFNFQEMVYGSAAFSEVLSDLERVAPTDATVLILGESGTGKELLARALHNLSLRKERPFIKVNCSAIPSELIESELFGHRKGSFTGAVADKAGKFELANGGTLFLDEIGDLPLAMQPKLLRFLQEGEMEVVGGTTTKSLDVRIVAATNKDLKKEVSKELFREDLFFRLNVFPLVVPPLRDRKEDIPILIEHFTNKYGKKYRKNIKYISDSAMQGMSDYNWPGNIRELENFIERSVILSDSETLSMPGFSSENDEKKREISKSNQTLNDVQKNHILAVLDKTDWKISGPEGAAVFLDIKPSTLRDKMKKLGIKRPNRK